MILGLVVGSFLNVCIDRLPRNQSIIDPPSHCPRCGNDLNFKDMIPILSYIWQKGRCRYCGRKISSRYVVVEALTGCLFVLCLMIQGMTIYFLKTCIFVSFLIVITWIDYDYQLILDKVLLCFALIGVVMNLLMGQVGIADMFFGGFICGGILLVVAIVSRGGMGGGDIKFAAALGLWLGCKMALFGLFLAFIFGGVVSCVLLILRINGRKDMIPYGPFIALGALIVLLYGSNMITWYLNLI